MPLEEDFIALLRKKGYIVILPASAKKIRDVVNNIETNLDDFKIVNFREQKNPVLPKANRTSKVIELTEEEIKLQNEAAKNRKFPGWEEETEGSTDPLFVEDEAIKAIEETENRELDDGVKEVADPEESVLSYDEKQKWLSRQNYQILDSIVKGNEWYLDIQKPSRITLNRMNLLLRNLKKRGYVESPQDGRYTITLKGREVHEKWKKTHLNNL